GHRGRVRVPTADSESSTVDLPRRHRCSDHLRTVSSGEGSPPGPGLAAVLYSTALVDIVGAACPREHRRPQRSGLLGRPITGFSSAVESAHLWRRVSGNPYREVRPSVRRTRRRRAMADRRNRWTSFEYRASIDSFRRYRQPTLQEQKTAWERL